MGMHTFQLTPSRIGKFKAMIVGHAMPFEVLSRLGRQVKMPENQSDTYIQRRYLPYNATSTNANTINRFFADGTGDRANAIAQANQVSEGITPTPDSITSQDTQVVIQQYACLYGFTDKTYRLYEDDIPLEATKQIGERVMFVNEMINWGALRACTNQFYGGTGTSIATVNGGLTLNLIRKVTQNIMANHGKMVSRVLKPSGEYGTSAVPPGFYVATHTDLEPDARDTPDFIRSERYASGTPMPNEMGSVERFRIITSPDLPSMQDAGAAVGATGLYSTSGANIDVYQVVVCAEDAFSQISLRGKQSLEPTILMPGEKSKSDPLGQRGYAGTAWWKACMIENNGWMAIINVGRKAL